MYTSPLDCPSQMLFSPSSPSSMIAPPPPPLPPYHGRRRRHRSPSNGSDQVTKVIGGGPTSHGATLSFAPLSPPPHFADRASRDSSALILLLLDPNFNSEAADRIKYLSLLYWRWRAAAREPSRLRHFRVPWPAPFRNLNDQTP